MIVLSCVFLQYTDCYLSTRDITVKEIKGDSYTQLFVLFAESKVLPIKTSGINSAANALTERSFQASWRPTICSQKRICSMNGFLVVAIGKLFLSITNEKLKTNANSRRDGREQRLEISSLLMGKRY